MALKIIFGFGNTYNQLLEKTGLRTLKDRREEACLKFAIKLKDSERFSYLFPENPTFNLRVTKKYKKISLALNGCICRLCTLCAEC